MASFISCIARVAAPAVIGFGCVSAACQGKYVWKEKPGQPPVRVLASKMADLDDEIEARVKAYFANRPAVLGESNDDAEEAEEETEEETEEAAEESSDASASEENDLADALQAILERLSKIEAALAK